MSLYYYKDMFKVQDLEQTKKHHPDRRTAGR